MAKKQTTAAPARYGSKQTHNPIILLKMRDDGLWEEQGHDAPDMFTVEEVMAWMKRDRITGTLVLTRRMCALTGVLHEEVRVEKVPDGLDPAPTKGDGK